MSDSSPTPDQHATTETSVFVCAPYPAPECDYPVDTTTTSTIVQLPRTGAGEVADLTIWAAVLLGIGLVALRLKRR